EKVLVFLEEHEIVVQQRSTAKAMRGKPVERALVPLPIAFDAAEHRELIFLVGNAVALREAHLGAAFAQQCGAECVDRSARYALDAWAQLRGEAVRDLTRRFIREGERAHA